MHETDGVSAISIHTFIFIVPDLQGQHQLKPNSLPNNYLALFQPVSQPIYLHSFLAFIQRVLVIMPGDITSVFAIFMSYPPPIHMLKF